MNKIMYTIIGKIKHQTEISNVTVVAQVYQADIHDSSLSHGPQSQRDCKSKIKLISLSDFLFTLIHWLVHGFQPVRYNLIGIFLGKTKADSSTC